MESDFQNLDFLIADLKNKAEVEFFFRTDFIQEVTIEAFDLYLRVGRREAKVHGFEGRHSDMFTPRLDKYLKRFENDKNLYLSILRDMAIFYERTIGWAYSTPALNHTAKILADYLNSVNGIDGITGHETYTEAEKETYGQLFQGTNGVFTHEEMISRESIFMFVNNQIRSACSFQLEIIEQRLLNPIQSTTELAPEEETETN
ncbi:MAG: hypothetical protein ACOVSW_04025 [Candidatus Kapaibacteriota bacterium]